MAATHCQNSIDGANGEVRDWLLELSPPALLFPEAG
jgi:hypothetical protein